MTPSLTEAVARAIGKASAGPGDGTIKHWNSLDQWQRDYQIKKARAALAAIEAAGFEIVAKRQESAPITLEVGQRWVPTSPKAKPRTITKIGPHRSFPSEGDKCVFFDVEGETPGPYPHCLRQETFLRWTQKRDARLAARPGAGE